MPATGDEERLRSPIRGPYGRADLIDYSRWDQAETAATVCTWLLTSQHYHIAWSQWQIVVIRLGAFPGIAPAVLRFAGATHEVLIIAVDPTTGRQTPEMMATPGHAVPFLTPVNFADQFIATDDEMRRIAALMCWTICEGIMTPEPPLGYESFRTGWLTAITKTLAHERGEVHAS